MHKNTFTKDYIIAKRDSVMKANMPGELKGSYMGTELKYVDPQSDIVKEAKLIGISFGD